MNLTTVENLLITYPIRNEGTTPVFDKAVVAAAFLCGRGATERAAVSTVANALSGLEPAEQMEALLELVMGAM